MRLSSCLTVLQVCILAAPLLTLEAESEDSTCDAGIVEVHRNTVYLAVLGDDLRINCPVVFCNNSPPTVSWFKLGNMDVPVSVSSDSHIETEWEKLNHLKGISYLIFKNILRSDSGRYQCRSGGSVSHAINVSVYGDVGLTTVPPTTSEQNTTNTGGQTLQDTFLSFVYRLVGIVVVCIIVTIICALSHSRCKGVCCVRRSKDAPDPSHQPSSDSMAAIHIYENDQ